MRLVLLALAIAVLVGGAVYLGGQETGSGNRDLVATLYEEGDVQGVLDRLAPGSVTEQQRPQIERGLQQTFEQGATVVEQDTVTVRGVTLERTRTSDNVEWCVTPDEQILLQCRIGTVEATGQVDGAPLEVGFAVGTLFADRTQLSIVLSPPQGGDTHTLDGEFQLGGDLPVEIQQLALLSQGQRLPLDPGQQIDLRPGVGLLLQLTASPDVEFSGETLTISWDGGTATVEFDEVTSFL